MGQVIESLRQALIRQDGAGLKDEQLLECFVGQRDEAAFEAIVRRHGSMVMGVCRRVLRNRHDAEDAFQATFLVLVRKAASIKSRELLANWLYGVAYKTALKAKAAAAKRCERERQFTEMPEIEMVDLSFWHELAPVLDRELSRLPEKYRVPILLCDLEGKSQKEAARQLQCPQGTLSGRLARARVMLMKRLAPHGAMRSGGSLAIALAGAKASASVSASLVAATVKAGSQITASQAVAAGLISAKVAALTEGVLRTMVLAKLKIVGAVVLAVGFITAGTGFFSYSGFAGETEKGPTAPQKRNDDDLQQAREAVDQAKKALETAKAQLSKTSLEKTLRELDERWWKADVQGLRGLAADEFISVSGVGRYDKAALLAASENRRAINGIRREIEVKPVGKDVAIITYIYDCKVVLTDGTLFQNCRDRRVSMVWSKRQHGWVAVFSQETVLPGGE